MNQRAGKATDAVGRILYAAMAATGAALVAHGVLGASVALASTLWGLILVVGVVVSLRAER